VAWAVEEEARRSLAASAELAARRMAAFIVFF
jgi:hypothetical protein